MGTVLVKNGTDRTIHVRVTANGERGDEGFTDISPGATEAWSRGNWQVAFALRDDNSKTDTFVTEPDKAYTVE